ncbi:hypothetical protein S245_031090 [Arachis hypogaea]
MYTWGTHGGNSQTVKIFVDRKFMQYVEVLLGTLSQKRIEEITIRSSMYACMLEVNNDELDMDRAIPEIIIKEYNGFNKQQFIKHSISYTDFFSFGLYQWQV